MGAGRRSRTTADAFTRSPRSVTSVEDRRSPAVAVAPDAAVIEPTRQGAVHVPDAVAPPPRNPRFPLLDGMRAIAVLAVVAVHVGVAGGIGGSIPARLVLHLNIGVTIFFLISGFLLYRPFIAHRTGGARAPRATRYARRRLLRILPAYWLVLTIVVIVPGLTATTDSLVPQYALTFMIDGSRGWVCDDCGLSQTWSLAIEASFYLALPLYALIADRLASGRPTRTWLALELGGLATLSLATIILHFVIYDGFPSPLVGGSLISYGFWFALGMGLALISVAHEDRDAAIPRLAAVRGHPQLLWLLAAALFVLTSLALPGTTFLVDASDQLFAFLSFGVIALLLLIPAVFSVPEGLPSRLLSHPAIAWLGLISYGIFLWHVAVVTVLETRIDEISLPALAIATLTITIAIASLSYYLVERPLLRFKR